MKVRSTPKVLCRNMILQISAFFFLINPTLTYLLDVQSCVPALSLDQVKKVSRIFHQLIITTKSFDKTKIFHSRGIVSHFFYSYVSRHISLKGMCLSCYLILQNDCKSKSASVTCLLVPLLLPLHGQKVARTSALEFIMKKPL